MRNITDLVTATTPSAFGMPISGGTPMSGHAWAATSPCGTAVATSVVREAKAVTGAVLAQGYFPGTTAWRPPS